MTIIESLERYAPLSEECKKALLERAKIVIIPANTGLLCPDQISDRVYFIEKGIIRVYYYADEDADADASSITSWFGQEGGIVSSISSFLSQKPSTEHIQTLEKCHCRVLTYNDLEELYVEFPELNLTFRKLYQFYIQIYERRMKLLKTKDFTKRYLYFLKIYPTLANRVKDKDIASYLEMSAGKLCSLKKEIYKSKRPNEGLPNYLIS